jgi:hypothetical protein
MSEPYKGLNAALARNSGPSAEDVEALRSLLAALRYGSHTFTTHEMAERIATSDWLAAHTAAAEARGAERGARAVVEAVEAVQAVVARMGARQVDHRHEDETGHWGVRGRAYFYAGDVYDDWEDLKAALAAARDAAARIEGGA